MIRLCENKYNHLFTKHYVALTKHRRVWAVHPKPLPLQFIFHHWNPIKDLWRLIMTIQEYIINSKM